MKAHIYENSEKLGFAAADMCAGILNNAISRKGGARLLLSTGASQFDVLNELIKKDIDWSKVEMFHLDEYIGLPESHPASFRKYLKERFISKINLGIANFVDGEGDIAAVIEELSDKVRNAPIDVGLIGIGENAHIAFNDPPADFDTKDAFIIVTLDEKCKNQQVREGWFPTLGDVPKLAVSMSVYQIMQCEKIISCVPYKVKANAIKLTLENELTNNIPATMLKTHSDIDMFLDVDSASETNPDILKKYI